MLIIKYVEIVVSEYHGRPMLRLRFVRGAEPVMEESVWLSPDELNDVLDAWRKGKLFGSFGIDTCLAEDAFWVFRSE